MVYLIEKGRIPVNALDDVLAAISDPKNVVRQVPIDLPESRPPMGGDNSV